MSQTTSQTWRKLLATPGTTAQYKFKIGDTWYDKTEEVSSKAESMLYSDFGIGNVSTAHLELQVFSASEIPRAATIERWVQLVNGSESSEWLQKGVFFTSTREEEDGWWKLSAYDAMRKAQKVWEPSQDLTFPMSMPSAVALIAADMGVELDSRTELLEEYTVDYPANDITEANVLAYIAAAHGGNWIITDPGKLFLVPLASLPGTTNYLVDEESNYIVFGGVRILV